MKRRTVKKRFRVRARTWRKFAYRWAVYGEIEHANACHAEADQCAKDDVAYRANLRLIRELKRRCAAMKAIIKETTR